MLVQSVSTDKVALREAVDDDDALWGKDRIWRYLAPYLTSTVVHLVLILILGLWLVARNLSDDVDLTAFITQPEGVQLDRLTPGTDAGTDEVTIVEPVELPSLDPFAGTSDLETLPTESNTLDAREVESALSGRSEGLRQALAGKYGASGESEKAVLLGLEWLARNQGKDGLWSLRGPYASAANYDNPEAATAMALLAFQGAGNTHKAGQFQKNVAAGIAALLKQQQGDGNFFRGAQMAPAQRFEDRIRSDDWLYCHAQCTIALCELYGMTKDSTLREPAARAVEFCIQAQDPNLGGWRYAPRVDSDTSVTGWMVMALQSAKMAGLDVPSTTLGRVDEFLDSVARGGPKGSLYVYQYDYEPTPAMTAEGLLCRQYLGWPHTDKRLVAGVEYLLDNLPMWEERDVYYWYYATQVMHHMEGNYWTRWNSRMRDLLVQNQVVDGAERGSWDPKGKHPDLWAGRDLGGRLYVTCMSLYMLEVYYRHLPIYSTTIAQRP